MSTNYDDEIRLAEAEYQLDAQQSAIKRIDLDILKMKRKMETYEETKVDLRNEIEKSKEVISKLKKGEAITEGGEK
jgi:hypothetical protein